MVANAPSPTLKFDTDFDFDSSNAQFIKEALEEKFQERLTLKGWLSAEVANNAPLFFLFLI